MGEVTIQSVKTLIEQKDAMEQEIQQLLDWLQEPGRPGLTGGLVDEVKYQFSQSQIDKCFSERAVANCKRRENEI